MEFPQTDKPFELRPTPPEPNTTPPPNFSGKNRVFKRSPAPKPILALAPWATSPQKPLLLSICPGDDPTPPLPLPSENTYPSSPRSRGTPRDRRQPQGIDEVDGVAVHIGVEVDPARGPDGIGLDKTPQDGVVVAQAVVVEARGLVIEPARVADGVAVTARRRPNPVVPATTIKIPALSRAFLWERDRSFLE